MKVLCLLKKLKCTSNVQHRWNSSLPQFKLVNEVQKLIEDEEIKPKHQPGIIKQNMVILPEWIVKAMDESLDDVNRAQILSERLKFSNYLFSRKVPAEEYEVSKLYSEIENKILEKEINNLSNEELATRRKQLKGEISFKVKQKIFSWKALQYNNYRSLLYMMTRSTPEYAVLYNIFKEIKFRDPTFDPQTMFDFGSGVGSVLWAATNYWKNINEYIGIDVSNEMNEISQKIISKSPRKIKGVFYRQYFPYSNLRYDLVVSAYSLMELPSSKHRLETISKLWRKTNKYLVIIEQGTNAGFKLVNEVRDFVRYILDNHDDKTKYLTFAPCPHDLRCPRYIENQSPCNFIAQYQTLPLLGPCTPKVELYSYVVLKKGDQRTENDNWYRLVRTTHTSSKKAQCQMCTAYGELKSVVFTPSKYGKPLYRCAKASKWGDRLPIEPTSQIEKSSIDIKEQTLSSEKIESKENESNPEDQTKIECEEKDEFLFSENPISIKIDIKNQELTSKPLKSEEEKLNSANETEKEYEKNDEVVYSDSPFSTRINNK